MKLEDVKKRYEIIDKIIEKYQYGWIGIIIVTVVLAHMGLTRKITHNVFCYGLGIWLAIFVIICVIGRRLNLFIYRSNKEKIKNEEPIWWKKHPPGEKTSIFDNKTGEFLGTISNEQLKFLIDFYTDGGFNDNNFYFHKVLLDMFIKVSKPPQDLVEFLKKSLHGKEEIELHWD